MSPSPTVWRIQEAMAEAGVSYALVLTSYLVNPNRPSTAEVVRAVERIDTLGVVAGISYRHYRERVLRRARRLPSCRAGPRPEALPRLRAVLPARARLQVVYELAEEFDVPVMIHSGDTYDQRGRLKYAHPLEVDEVAVDHPNVKLVICHLGNPWLVDYMEVVYKTRNVYADFSGLVLGEFTEAFEDYMERRITDAILYAGEPDRLLYGSDWPICGMKSYVEFVRQLPMPEHQRHAILYENARRLFKLPLPPAAQPAAAGGSGG